MRLFVAAGISDDTRAAMRGVRASIERSVAGAIVPPRITWVRDASAHVTLCFIGEVADAMGAAIQSALSPSFPLASFDIDWVTAGVFPHGRAGERSPRTIWIGPSAAGTRALTELAGAVNWRVKPVAGAGDDRPFSAHLTVGRIKSPGRGVRWPEALADAQPAPTRSRVDRVTLYRSELSASGPTYTAMCEAELHG